MTELHKPCKAATSMINAKHWTIIVTQDQGEEEYEEVDDAYGKLWDGRFPVIGYPVADGGGVGYLVC